MAHKIPDYRVPEGLHIDLDRVADVTDPAAPAGVFDALPKALLGDVNQPLGRFAHLAAGIGGGAVAVEAADKGAHINADDVPLLQLPGIGDAVNDHLIHRNAGRSGKAAVAQKGGLCAMALNKPADGTVNLVGGDPRTDHGAGQSPGLSGEPPGPAHGLDLPWGL